MALGPDYYSLRDHARVFDDIAVYDRDTVNWDGVEKPEQLVSADVSASFFNVLATPPLLGRYLAPGEDGRDAPRLAVLSYALWRARFGSDPPPSDASSVSTAIPPPSLASCRRASTIPKAHSSGVPNSMDAASQLPRSAMRPMRGVNMIARVKRHVDRQQLAAEMTRLSGIIRAEYPPDFEKIGFVDGLRIVADPLQRRMTGDVQPALMILSGAVALVLLIACANLANLLLARAAGRQRELAVRMALGAGRARIVRQVLAESITLALPGGLAGIAVAYWAVAAMNAFQPMVLASYPPIQLDLRTLAFSFVLTLFTGIVFGLAPAWGAAGVRIRDAFQTASYGHSASRSTARLRQLLVVVELGVSLVLLIGAGLLARSFLNLARVDLGLRARAPPHHASQPWLAALLRDRRADGVLR